MRRFRPFGDSRGICRVRTPKLSFKFSIGMAHRDPKLPSPIGMGEQPQRGGSASPLGVEADVNRPWQDWDAAA
jgi:hypothetical protein